MKNFGQKIIEKLTQARFFYYSQYEMELASEIIKIQSYMWKNAKTAHQDLLRYAINNEFLMTLNDTNNWSWVIYIQGGVRKKQVRVEGIYANALYFHDLKLSSSQGASDKKELKQIDKKLCTLQKQLEKLLPSTAKLEVWRYWFVYAKMDFFQDNFGAAM